MIGADSTREQASLQARKAPKEVEVCEVGYRHLYPLPQHKVEVAWIGYTISRARRAPERRRHWLSERLAGVHYRWPPGVNGVGNGLGLDHLHHPQ